MKISFVLLCAAVAATPLHAEKWNRKNAPQHVVQEEGAVCRLTEENMLRRNQKISAYADGAFVIDKPDRGNGEAFFLRHPIRVAPLTGYEITGRITVDKLEGEPRIFRVELLDANREEFTTREFSLPENPRPGESVEFRFPFQTLRGTPFLRTWIVTDSKTTGRFRIENLQVVQTGPPRGRETAPLQTKESGDAAALEVGDVPAPTRYLRLSARTTGRPDPATPPLRVEILGEAGRALTVYELRWEAMSGLRPEWDRIAGTWFEPTRGFLGSMGFSRLHQSPGTGEAPPVLRWEEELAVPEGARRVRIAGPEGGNFRVAEISVALHAEADKS
jgi:hypothetical protein